MPALADEAFGERAVAVEHRPAPARLLIDVELDLGARLLVVVQERGGLEGEVA